MNKKALIPLFLTLGFAAGSASSAIVVENSNFISSPTNFNGFEGIGAQDNFPSNTVYSEGGINVEYIGSAEIWTTYTPSIGGEGNYGWYPNGGGQGYTAITLASNADFQNIQFLLGNGFTGNNAPAAYQLLENGTVVLTGTTTSTYPMSYLGFSGPGFNQVDIKSNYSLGPFDPTAYEAAAIDSIAVATPIPAALWLVGSGLAGVFGFARRKAGKGIQV